MSLAVSFEVFPPKTAEGLDQLAVTSIALDRVDPAYVSITFGAGGSLRDRSFASIKTISQNSNAPVAGHLTCVGMSTREVDQVIDRYRALGISHIVALRGDPPEGIDAPYTPHPDGYRTTADLVGSIKRRGSIEVSVSGYPERHPQSPTDRHDLDVLAAKVAAGADRAITQMFFDNSHLLRYRDRVRSRGIDIPIVPGIFPIHSLTAVSRFARRCGASMPHTIAQRFSGIEDGKLAAHEIAADIAAEQIEDLAANGFEHVHIYTLNRAHLALAVCERLGLGQRAVAR